MAQNDTLTTTQKRTIAALLCERNVRSAAKAVKGVGERTLWRWLSDPVFREELTRQEGAMLDQATRGLLVMQDNALKVFDEILKDENAKDSDRLRAAEKIMDFLIKLRTLFSLEMRIQKLEESQNDLIEY